MTSLGAAFHATGGTGLARALLLAYPLGDVLLAVLAVRVLVSGSIRHRPLLLVGLGVLALGVSDSAFTYLQADGAYSEGWLDLGWIAGFALLGLAGTCRAGALRAADGTGGPSGGRSAVLPYLPGLVALAVVGVGALSGRPLQPVEELATCLVVLALIGRQFLTLRDNSRLTAALLAREEELRHQAFHDPLTQVANSALFRDRLDHALARRGRDLARLTVVFVDLDHFKVVNDTHGHAAGDRLLVEVARRLVSGVRPGDTVARLGGDEFAVLVEDGGLPEERAAGIAAALRGAVWVTGDVAVEVSASIGVHGLGPDDPELAAEDVLAAADAAMYAVKRTRAPGTTGIRTSVPAGPAGGVARALPAP
jgi:diguanylate cyclase (GGDEF)-like protein